MRTNDTLMNLEELTTLYQYLYMSSEHFITIDNGVTKLELKMDENCRFCAKNLHFPELPDLDYTDAMNIPNTLAIIKQLKNTSATEFPNRFSNRWDEIVGITSINVGQNRINMADMK